MVGSTSDAEDLVQEAFLRFHREQRRGTDIASPKAWLSTVTTRLAINHVQAARVPGALCRHLAARAAGDRDGVGGPAACRDGRLAVAGVPGAAGEPRPGRAGGVCCGRCSSTATTRSRPWSAEPRQLPPDRGPGPPAGRGQEATLRGLTRKHEELSQRFFDAVEADDTQGLVRLLAADVVVYADGGGKSQTPTIRRPLYGRERFARMFSQIRPWQRLGRAASTTPRSTGSRERCT
jgi:RNA polymerase sigma-70 factor (ECF subfamily)